MKKIISFIAVLAIGLLQMGVVMASFEDVSDSHVNYDAVNYVQGEGIVDGYADGSYKADATINRAEFTKIIVGAVYSQQEIDDCITSVFPDISTEDWFAPYICVAEEKGIIDGYPDNTFQPANDILVVEAAKIIVNGFEHEVGSDDVWYKPYVEDLEGFSALPTSFSGFEHKVTRGEMAEMIYRLLDDVTDKSSSSYDSLAGVVVEEVAFDTFVDMFECEKVKTVNFVVDEENHIQYGAFTWNGQLVSVVENEDTYVRLEVQSDGSAAFDYYKDRALSMENQGFNRYENDLLSFAVGNVVEGSLVSLAEDLSEETASYILEQLDSGNESTLTFAVKFLEGGGAGDYVGLTSACSIGM